MLKRLSLLLSLFWLTLPLLAQENSLNYLKSPAIVESVTLNQSGAGTSLIVTGYPNGCEVPSIESQILTQGFSPVIVVSLTTPPVPPNVRCMPAPFELTVDLGMLDIDTLYTLLVNDFSSQFLIPNAEGILLDAPALVVRWDVPNELFPYMRENMDILAVELGKEPVKLAVMVGMGGCQGDVLYTVTPDLVEADLYHIDLFRVFPQDLMCTMQYVEQQVVVDTQLGMNSGNSVFEIGGNYYAYDGSLTPITRQFITVEAVEINPAIIGYAVLVRGMQGGDCGIPLESTQLALEGGSVLNIFVDVPEGTGCTKNLIAYEQAFTVESLPVYVNDVAYGLEESMVNPPVLNEGMFESDVVVESIDLLVLESFPMQIHAVVRGYHSDGCNIPVTITQSREGNTVNVHVYRLMSAAMMCPAMIMPYEATIPLEGTFEGGHVIVNVNGFVVERDL